MTIAETIAETARLIGVSLEMNEERPQYPRDRQLTGDEEGLCQPEWLFLQSEGLLSNYPILDDNDNIRENMWLNMEKARGVKWEYRLEEERLAKSCKFLF